MIKKIKIGNIEVKNNVFLAPMAGVTDLAFRRICREFGPGLTFTEMVSSTAMWYGDKKTKGILNIDKEERPSIVQIFGHDSSVIAKTIEILNEDESVDIIDINMGCPAPKLVKNGDGAGLLLDLKNVEKIITTAVKTSNKPITVKTRKGFDEEHITAVDVAKICEMAGVSMITVHGRTREEYYKGRADLDIIAKVKQSVNIPVIGNGDIFDLESANNMFYSTGCDGIMIARGAQGNPWIFKEILEGKKYNVDYKEKLDIMLKHIKYEQELQGDKTTNLIMRKHIDWYLKGLEGSSRIKEEVNKQESIEETKNILIEYFETL